MANQQTGTPIVYSEISDTFALDGQGGIQRVFNADAVNAGIRNILLTRKGERVMLPTFGSGIQDYIFEAMDPDLTDVLAQQIKTDVETWEPRVNVQAVKFNSDPDRQTITMQMYYQVLGFDNVFQFSQTFST